MAGSMGGLQHSSGSSLPIPRMSECQMLPYPGEKIGEISRQDFGLGFGLGLGLGLGTDFWPSRS